MSTPDYAAAHALSLACLLDSDTADKADPAAVSAVLHPAPWAGSVVAAEAAAPFRQMRVGLVGCANIGKKAWRSIHRAGHIVVAAASRSAAKAEAYVAACNDAVPFAPAPRGIEGYANIIDDTEVDAVYIPLPTTQHVDWVLRAAAKGKHVVCEKPCAVSLGDLEAMLKCCQQHNVAFVDGTMLSHGRRIKRLRRVLDAGAIGTVRTVDAAFVFNGGSEFEAGDIRVNPECDPLGALGDIGWYCIRYWVDARPDAVPVRSRGRITDSINGVNVSFDGEVEFATRGTDARTLLRFHVSFREANQQRFTIYGSDGTITVDDFCLPMRHRDTSFTVERNTIAADDVLELRHELRREELVVDGEPSDFQECQLWRNVGHFATTVPGDADHGAVLARRTALARATWTAHAAMFACLASCHQEHQPFVDVPPRPTWL